MDCMHHICDDFETQEQRGPQGQQAVLQRAPRCGHARQGAGRDVQEELKFGTRSGNRAYTRLSVRLGSW